MIKKGVQVDRGNKWISRVLSDEGSGYRGWREIEVGIGY